MKNEKMFTKLLSVFFILSLSINLHAQVENKNKHKEIKLKVIAEKKHSDSENNKMVWVVKGNDFEWDTTFNINEDREIDIDEFLRKRFPDLDSSMYRFKQMQVLLDGDCRKLRVLHNAHIGNVLELKSILGENKRLVHLELDELDSLLSNHAIHKSYVISKELNKNTENLHKHIGALKFEIFDDFDDNLEHKMRVEILANVEGEMKNMEDEMKDMEYVYHHTEGRNKNFLDIHKTKEFSIGLIIDDELNEDDISNIENAGLKISKNKLELHKVYLYTDDENLFNLKFKLKTEGKTTIKIINAEGNKIFYDKVQYFPGTYDKQTKLNMEDKGLYYIYIEQNKKTFVCRMTLD